MTKREPGKVPRIAASIAAKIERGVYPPGSALPSVPELQAAEGIAYQTARDVYGLLEDQGLVFTRRGKGTYVSLVLGKVLRDGTGRYLPTARSEGGAVGAFDAEIRRMGLVPKPTPVVIARERPPKCVAELLGLHHASKALKRARVMPVTFPDNDEVSEVVQLATSWFPPDLADQCPQLEQQNTGPGGSKSRLAEIGQAQVRLREEIEVRPPSEEEAAGLGIPVDQAVLEITHMGITAEGRIVEVCLHVMPRTKWRLAYEWEIGS
ncbi:GntR family transcriptional regulator [Streptomyces marianii]|uniref:GntR family transcriptional regulator n=1 Tax=Streptomyces marianii TaxID=1817406 RepID=A0A5R9DSJ2_9ACTN|nr:GntR family transcriptional regulator [Streptomyces marianii]TLQ38994.1 GntR family transcriptional regulator [Streptomyces marianii]